MGGRADDRGARCRIAAAEIYGQLSALSTVDLTPILPQIATPALILAGERSAMNTPERTRGMAELLPNGRLVEVPGAGGYVQHAAPEQCVAIWREFVTSLG
jgi:pimeloyl-ACP methyl ester carboxylesterase